MRKKVTSIALLVLVTSMIIGNIPAAREHFLSAMKIFNEIIQQISERTSTSETALSVSQPAEAPRISNEIDRSERYIDQLKSISDKNGFEIDFSHAYELIDIARNQLGEGNSEAANSTIEVIKRSISELNETLREKTRQYTTDRAKTLAEKYLEDLDILIAEAEEIGVSQETLAKLVEIKEHLNSASDSSDVDQIINELRHLISAKQDFEDTKIERLKSRVNQLESKIVQLSNYPYKIPELGKAQDMLLDLMVLISGGSYNEAVRVLNSLNDLINEIEYSISQRDEEITANEEDSSSSLDDSKTERIKIKIQRLETAINKQDEVWLHGFKTNHCRGRNSNDSCGCLDCTIVGPCRSRIRRNCRVCWKPNWYFWSGILYCWTILHKRACITIKNSL